MMRKTVLVLTLSLLPFGCRTARTPTPEGPEVLSECLNGRFNPMAYYGCTVDFADFSAMIGGQPYVFDQPARANAKCIWKSTGSTLHLTSVPRGGSALHVTFEQSKDHCYLTKACTLYPNTWSQCTAEEALIAYNVCQGFFTACFP
jgi:hypothetical protein